MEQILKEAEKVTFSTCDELLIELKKNNFKASPRIEDIVKKNNYKFNNNKFSVKLVRALGLYFIETYCSHPKAIFHTHNDFVMMVK